MCKGDFILCTDARCNRKKQRDEKASTDTRVKERKCALWETLHYTTIRSELSLKEKMKSIVQKYEKVTAVTLSLTFMLLSTDTFISACL